MKHRFFIFLFCIKQFNGERSIFGVYHLLKGKKSSQTIQDAMIYRLSFLFSTMTDITREELISFASSFQREGFLECKDENTYILSKSGDQLLDEAQKKWSFPKYLQGWRYATESRLFWKRFVLVTQCLSNLLIDKRHFQPISNDNSVQRWVKDYFGKVRHTKEELSKGLVRESTAILSKLDSLEADIFIMHMTSANRIGWTIDQIAEKLEKDASQVTYLFQHALHYFVKEVNENPSSYPILRGLMNKGEQVPLTASTQKTLLLVNKELTISQIAKVRGLKESTIEDHLVEIALHDKGFSIDPYVDIVLQERIVMVSKQVGHRKIKLIWERAQPTSYFQIRLVLAKQYKQK